MSNIRKARIHKEICDSMNELYIKKNADYGDSVGIVYEKLGDISILTRISDKYNRLMGLMDPKNTNEPNFESIDDTIQDLANYALIWMMERKLAKKD